MIKLTIPGNTPCKKNSKRVFCPRNCRGQSEAKKRTGKYQVKANLVLSDTFEKWHKKVSNLELKTELKRLKNGLYFPVTALFFFYRNSTRQFDYTGAIESVQDLLVELGFLPDDNADIISPVAAGYIIDRANPRCEVYIFKPGEEWFSTFLELGRLAHG